MNDSSLKFFIDWNVVCPRRKFDGFKIKKYLELNSCELVGKPQKADFIFLVTCAVRKIEEEVAFKFIKK